MDETTGERIVIDRLRETVRRTVEAESVNLHPGLPPN